MNTQKDLYMINYYHHFSKDEQHYKFIRDPEKDETIEELIEYFEVKLMQLLGWDAGVIELTKMIDDIETIRVDKNTKNRDKVRKWRVSMMLKLFQTIEV